MNGEERSRELKVELERILEILRKAVHPEKVILFGSLASGRLKAESDIDLLIVQESDDSIFERVRKLEGLLNRKYAADLIILTPGEVQSLLDSDNRYIKQIFSRGKVLYDRAA